ncbi:MAG TPA: DUF3090 domain-containing protein [Ornithinimicrobium sp.]|uniref:DUF3090 domain-containing protein n=1 Tax=Ornithinimicrobium sp. TaxID=1977084 RepID=UPI002B4843FC|nr:DUF3090 domain-containing protein [Ornithinimicrobium sp.]HKJ12520.1 DUF3090 domain-containing protein [Ornithinimicrobium sp.]
MPAIEFDPPERFIADSVGPAGQRTFFLQAVQGTQVMTVSLEKEQVRLLGEGVAQLLDEMAGDEASSEPTVVDTGALHTPIEEDFRARQLTLAWNETRRLVVIEATDRETEDEDGDESSTGPDPDPDPQDPIGSQSVIVRLPVGMARGFAERCEAAMSGGRPNCPFCGGPLDPGGHICPRANGYKR